MSARGWVSVYGDGSPLPAFITRSFQWQDARSAAVKAPRNACARSHWENRRLEFPSTWAKFLIGCRWADVICTYLEGHCRHRRCYIQVTRMLCGVKSSKHAWGCVDITSSGRSRVPSGTAEKLVSLNKKKSIHSILTHAE